MLLKCLFYLVNELQTRNLSCLRCLPDCPTDKINPLAAILTLKFQNAVYSEYPPQYIHLK